jgi:hypothetical protein
VKVARGDGRAGPPPAIRAARLGAVLGGTGLSVTAGALGGGFGDWPGAVHLVAPAPVDLYADVRLLVARLPQSWMLPPALVAVAGARGGLWWLALGPSRVPVRTLGALPWAAASAALDAAGRAALYSQLAWAALGIALVGAGLGLRRFTRGVLRSGAPAPGSAALLGAYGVALVSVGSLGAAAGGSWPLALVPVSAAATGLLVSRLGAPAPRGRPAHRSRLVPVLTLGASVGLVALVAWGLAAPAGRPTRAAPRPGSVLLVPGMSGSTGRSALFRLDPARLGYRCEQVWYFSYAGPAPGERRAGPVCPIRDHRPYGGEDTMAPLGRLVELLVAQTEGLPRPLVLVTHSQGAWVVHAALAAGRVHGVSHVVMLGPFGRTLQPYPPPGRWGRGAVAGDALRWLSRLGRAVRFTAFDPDRPLPATLQGRPGAVQRLFARPSGVRALAILAALDVPLVHADPWARHGVRRACPLPTTHSGLATGATAPRLAGAWLDGAEPSPCRPGAWLLGPLTAPFGVPSP